MEHYSILDQDPSRPAAKTDPHGESSSALPTSSPEPLRFPGDDGGKSLTEMAQRDLVATLQLLAERAQYITGAAGAAIVLRHGDDMVCQASAGSSAPEVGAHLQVNSGLSGESIRTRQTLRCDDAENDPRVNRESCRMLGIVSVVVMPLKREQEVIGVFELFSDRAYAFEERDISALERVAEMIYTALEHADAAKRMQTEIAGKDDDDDKDEVLLVDEVDAIDSKTQATAAAASSAPVHLHPGPVTFTIQPSAAAEQSPQSATVEGSPPVLGERGKIGKCQVCGFPVSEGRSLCLDCEKNRRPDQKPAVPSPAPEAPAFLSRLAATQAQQQGWLRSHVYLIGAVLVVASTVAALLWFR